MLFRESLRQNVTLTLKRIIRLPYLRLQLDLTICNCTLDLHAWEPCVGAWLDGSFLHASKPNLLTEHAVRVVAKLSTGFRKVF